MTNDICGETTNKGEPCTKKPGWGTDRDGGPCKYHSEEMQSRIQSTKKEILEILEEKLVTLKKAARMAGTEQSTVWRWRQQDEGFDEKMEEALEQQESMRLKAVEEALFRDCLTGDAAAAERIFYLKNRGSERWSDKQEFKHSTGSDDDKGVVERLREAHKALNNEEDD